MAGDWVTEDGDRIVLIATAEEGRPPQQNESGGFDTAQAIIEGGETELYRHFDARGVLLYIGISYSTGIRLAQHRAESEWGRKIARVEIEYFPTRAEAKMAEDTAIGIENPKYNKAGKLPEAA